MRQLMFYIDEVDFRNYENIIKKRGKDIKVNATKVQIFRLGLRALSLMTATKAAK